MAQAYFQHGMFAPATFSFFVRKFPPDRAYFVAAGLEDVLHFLEEIRFTKADIDYLHSTAMFSDNFLEYLKGLRFAGDVWAVPEGKLFFCDEPVIEVTAPIIEAQIVETFVVNQTNFQSLIATKASRTVFAARGKRVVDFSLRRTHGIDAGMKVARASFIGGFEATSNVLAGQQYGIPVVGTMAHSFVIAFEREIDAFRAFADSFPDNTVLLVDTYDTLEGARKAAVVALELEARGKRARGVRLDSGDISYLSREVRRILDEARLSHVRIVASGGLDEHEVARLLENGAPVDSFGVGTKMGVSADAPWLDCAYKLVKYKGRPVLKLSTGKATLPDEKQVFRYRDEAGLLHHDVIGLRHETPPDGAPAEHLLSQVMRGGRRLGASPTLKEAQERFIQEFARLPAGCKVLQDPRHYPVELSPGLTALRDRIQQEVVEEEIGKA
ncbi:MAG: nicotinate phosphoribosyltransferase [Chloroflexi bacterium]|nr:nicotinate phosphoribosyltransferase [Chloroflexota bacterium]